jgi:phosphoserine phosphatase
MPKLKLVIFDFDGTFAYTHKNSGWDLIDDVLGCKEKEEELRKDFNAGLIDFQNWSEKSCEIYRNYGLTIQRLGQIVSTYVKPTNGVPKVLSELGDLGIKTGIISGSIFNIYEFFSKRYGTSVDYPRFASRFTFDSIGNLIGGEFTNYDYEGKVHALKELCGKLSISHAEVAMIGNDVNDISVFKESGISIAFNPREEIVAKAANHTVLHDMTKVLQYLNCSMDPSNLQ